MNNIQDYLQSLQLLAPELWIVAAIVVCALWNQFFPQAKAWTPVWCLLALVMSGLGFWQQFPLAPTSLFGNPGPFMVDKLTVGFSLLSCLVGIVVVLMNMGCEHQFADNRGEFYAILMGALLAVMLLSGTTDLVLLFVSLETLTICCVLLASMFKKDRKSNEAGLKYLLSTAATTATFLYGLSFLYGLTGTTNYLQIHERMAPLLQSPTLLVVFLIVLLISAIGFKLSMVPFHMWAPDVFEGAPTSVAAFLSIGSKAGGFVMAIRLLSFVFAAGALDWTTILGALAIFSMIAGNFIALAQSSLKRMLAYSSIAHVGYILIGLVANSAAGLSAMFFYLIVYGLMNLGAFTGALLFSNETGSDDISDMSGLIHKRPWLALGLSVCLLSLAGLPVPPAGFFAKAFVFWSGVQMFSPLGWTLVGVALVTSVPAIYYYTRVVIKMIVREPSDKVASLPDERTRLADPQVWPMCALSLCVLGIFLGSISVIPFMNLSCNTVSPMVKPPALSAVPGTID